MKHTYRLTATVACTLFLLGPVSHSVGADTLKTKVNRAIKSGVAYLKQSQAKDGTWSFPNEAAFQAAAGDTDAGATALAGLALLECGVPASDEAVQKAAALVRQRSVQMTYTYTLSLAIMFLDRLGEPGDVALIE